MRWSGPTNVFFFISNKLPHHINESTLVGHHKNVGLHSTRGLYAHEHCQVPVRGGLPKLDNRFTAICTGTHAHPNPAQNTSCARPLQKHEWRNNVSRHGSGMHEVAT